MRRKSPQAVLTPASVSVQSSASSETVAVAEANRSASVFLHWWVCGAAGSDREGKVVVGEGEGEGDCEGDGEGDCDGEGEGDCEGEGEGDGDNEESEDGEEEEDKAVVTVAVAADEDEHRARASQCGGTSRKEVRILVLPLCRSLVHV